MPNHAESSASRPAPGLRPLSVIRLGIVPYREALELQRRLASDRIAGRLATDVLLLLQHPPVVTLGRSAREAHLVVPRELLASRGAEVFEVERGGDVTFHGPGQVVGYPVLDLKGLKQDLHWYLRQLEEALIRTLGRWGLEGVRNPGYTGVWTPGKAGTPAPPGSGLSGPPEGGGEASRTSGPSRGAPSPTRPSAAREPDPTPPPSAGTPLAEPVTAPGSSAAAAVRGSSDRESAARAPAAGSRRGPSGGSGPTPPPRPLRKIASIGVHARDWVTWHGFALNVSTDLSWFDLMVPCGIPDVQMTSMAAELGGAPAIGAVEEALAGAMGQVFGLEPREEAAA